MRTETITRVLYTAEELREHNPHGFDRAHDDYRQQVYSYTDHSDEWDSLRKFDEHVGFQRGRRYEDTTRGLGEAHAFTGRRAWAWLENVVIGPLRVPWSPLTRYGWLSNDRLKHTRYHEWPGTVPACPFTGYYMDEVILDDLRDSIRGGLCVFDAVRGLEEAVQREVDASLEHQTTEEGFLEWALNHDAEYTEEGERA
jgi:hypothetical protein